MDFNTLSTQYRGENARRYNETRVADSKWQAEQIALQALLDTVPNGLRTLDVPVGTGRLFPFYKAKGFAGTGMDVSPDMLEEARAHAGELGIEVDLRVGDIRNISFPDATFDLVMCIRFLNWVDTAGLEVSLRELTRVARDRLLVGIRHMTPLGDFRPTPTDLVRIVRRSLGHATARARKSGLVYHQKADVYAIFKRLGVTVEAMRHVEKRSDGTDYFIYVLRKAKA
ncbi:MAG TPA: class I SAM-dependent methyltransferase [Allosphingosinicella sp.]